MTDRYNHISIPFTEAVFNPFAALHFTAIQNGADPRISYTSCADCVEPKTAFKRSMPNRNPGEANLRQSVFITNAQKAASGSPLSSPSLTATSTVSVQSLEASPEPGSVATQPNDEVVSITSIESDNYDRLYAMMEKCQVAHQCHREYLALCEERRLSSSDAFIDTDKEDNAEYEHLASYIGTLWKRKI